MAGRSRCGSGSVLPQAQRRNHGQTFPRPSSDAITLHIVLRNRSRIPAGRPANHAPIRRHSGPLSKALLQQLCLGLRRGRRRPLQSRVDRRSFQPVLVRSRIGRKDRPVGAMRESASRPRRATVGGFARSECWSSTLNSDGKTISRIHHSSISTGRATRLPGTSAEHPATHNNGSLRGDASPGSSSSSSRGRGHARSSSGGGNGSSSSNRAAAHGGGEANSSRG